MSKKIFALQTLYLMKNCIFTEAFKLMCAGHQRRYDFHTLLVPESRHLDGTQGFFMTIA